MPNRFALRLLAMGLVLSACVAMPQSARAQGSGLFGSSGLTKGGTGGISGGLTGSGLGSSMGTSGRSGSSGGLGTSGFGGTGGGSNPFAGTGLAGMTGGGMGSTGFGGSGMTGMTNPFGTSGTNSGMVGRNSGAFAGNAQAGQTGGANAGGANRNFGRGNNNTSQRGNEFSQQSERTTSMVRPRQKVAFDYNLKAPAAVATKATTRLNKIGLKNPTLKGVEVKVDGDVLVLSGKVETAEQSRLAAILLRQEPGVRSIRNDLQVEKPSATE